MMTLEFKKRRLRLYRGITLMHALPDGSPVPKYLGLPRRKTVSGFLVNTPWGHGIWMFRRGQKW